MILNQQAKKYLKQHISGYVSKDQKNDDLSRYLRLDLGENLLGFSPKVLDSLKNITKEDFQHYADPSGSKTKTIIAGINEVIKENIILSNSSNEIIDYLPKITLEPKDKALIIMPTFYRHIESLLSAGATVIYQSLSEEENYQISEKLITKIINQINLLNIKFVWLCSPNNPTGNILNIAYIKSIVGKTKALIVLDEAFYEFDGLRKEKSGISLINNHKNLIVLRTLSKAYGLAGLRFGYALAHKETIEIIERYRNTLLMTSAITQKLVEAGLKDQSWLKNTVKKTKELKQQIFSAVKLLKNFHLASISKTNVYLLRHKNIDLYEELKKEAILTADFRHANGLVGKNYVRITVGKKPDNEKLLSILKKYD